MQVECRGSRDSFDRFHLAPSATQRSGTSTNDCRKIFVEAPVSYTSKAPILGEHGGNVCVGAS